VRRLLAGLVPLVLAGGCGLVPFDPTPDPEAGPGLVGDCTPPFVLDEETSLGALRIAQFAGLGPDLARPGRIRITEATIDWEDFAPPDVPPIVSEGQLLCVTWADGSGMSTVLHEPFGGVGIGVGVAIGAPAVLVGVGIGALLLVIVVSWLVFRREPGPSGG
jgi:hypothetical protein